MNWQQYGQSEQSVPSSPVQLSVLLSVTSCFCEDRLLLNFHAILSHTAFINPQPTGVESKLVPHISESKMDFELFWIEVKSRYRKIHTYFCFNYLITLHYILLFLLTLLPVSQCLQGQCLSSTPTPTPLCTLTNSTPSPLPRLQARASRGAPNNTEALRTTPLPAQCSTPSTSRQPVSFPACPHEKRF